MKYKTPFRLIVKLIGLLIVVSQLLVVIDGISAALGLMLMGPSDAGLNHSNFFTKAVLSAAMDVFLKIGLGVYLFLGARWITNLAIPGPGKWPRCPACSYDLTIVTRDDCPECGTNFRSPQTPAPPH